MLNSVARSAEEEQQRDLRGHAPEAPTPSESNEGTSDGTRTISAGSFPEHIAQGAHARVHLPRMASSCRDKSTRSISSLCYSKITQATFATRMGFMEYWQQYGPPDDCDLNDGKLTCH